jgi:hypothetical protein
MRLYDDELGPSRGQPQLVNRRSSVDNLLTLQCAYPAFATVEMSFGREKTSFASIIPREVSPCAMCLIALRSGDVKRKAIPLSYADLEGGEGHSGTCPLKTEFLYPSLLIGSC